MRPPAILRVVVLYTEKIIPAECAKFRTLLFLSVIQMSTQPEEIEEGEVVSDEYETEEETSLGDEENPEDMGDLEDMEDMEDLEDMEDDETDIIGLMTSLMATEDGDTVCSALVEISNQMRVQNKILIKILSKFQN